MADEEKATEVGTEADTQGGVGETASPEIVGASPVADTKQTAQVTPAVSTDSAAAPDSPEQRDDAAPKSVEKDVREEALPAPGGRRGKARSVPSGIAHVRSTFNNTTVTITDPRGGVIAWGSGGRAGFKGSRKSTAFAATLVGQDVARQAVARGMHEVEVRVRGAGAGRESAVRALQSSGLSVSVIKDVTPIPHNGCRPRKRRRV